MSIPKGKAASPELAVKRPESSCSVSSRSAPIRCQRKAWLQAEGARLGTRSRIPNLKQKQQLGQQEVARASPRSLVVEREPSEIDVGAEPEKPPAEQPSTEQDESEEQHQQEQQQQQQQQQPQEQQQQPRQQQQQQQRVGRATSQEKRPSSSSSRLRQSTSSGYGQGQKRVLENQFHSKKVRYLSMRREIDDKQKTSEGMYEEMWALRERLIECGGKDPGQLDELVPLPSWAMRGRLLRRSAEDAAPEQPEETIASELQSSYRATLDAVRAVCQQSSDRRAEFLHWLDQLPENIESGGSREELAARVGQLEEEERELQQRLEAVLSERGAQCEGLVHRVNGLWQECMALRLEQANATSRALMQQRSAQSAGPPSSSAGLKELKLERDKLARARLKIREQEAAVAAAEAKLRQLQHANKMLEEKLKCREASAKSSKTQDQALAKLERQRDTVESRMSKLKDELELKESAFKRQIEELQRELDATKRSRSELELEFEELKIRYAKLEDKCKQLLETQENRQVVPDDQHTEYEIQLFNDLKETQRVLSEKEEIISKLQHEREDIIAAVCEADQQSDCSEQRLSAELLKKSNELESVQSQFSQLQKNYKRLQQRSDGLEQKMSELNRLQAGMAKDGGSRSVYAAQVMQMQQQLSEVRGNLSEANAHNAELKKTCTQLQVKLEHYRRYIKTQERNLKLRFEMNQILQPGQQSQPMLEKESLKVSEDLQELYEALESKETQVMKLEKLVKQMENQEELSQAQRTRLENRIAKLELALKEGQQAYRSRGFSFL